MKYFKHIAWSAQTWVITLIWVLYETWLEALAIYEALFHYFLPRRERSSDSPMPLRKYFQGSLWLDQYVLDQS